MEKAEEVKKSFFHKTQTLSEKIKIKTLELIYPMEKTPKKSKDVKSSLYNELIESINDNYALSTRVTNYKDINYNSLLAFVEGFIV